VFFDEIKKIEGWARELGFYPTPLKYFQNGVAQVNQYGYSIRLYAKFTDDDRVRDKKYLYQFCSYIAEELNKQLQSNQGVVVWRESFIEGLKEVWSDVIGNKIQPLHLMRQLHDNVDTDFGRNNLPICYTYWRHGDFPLEAAQALGLPNQEVQGNNPNVDENVMERNKDDNEFDIDKEDGKIVD
jgi:hypothetical protein